MQSILDKCITTFSLCAHAVNVLVTEPMLSLPVQLVNESDIGLLSATDTIQLSDISPFKEITLPVCSKWYIG